MRHGSLFSGIGGFDLAAEWMGWDNVFHCEWNPFGQKVLKHYWPNSDSLNDITKTDFTKYANKIDILTGGFPCQPYSSAGKRLGKEDERHLWPEMLRAIREIKPKYVVGENVFGLLSWNGGVVFDEVHADLEAQGYEVQAVVIPAAAVNAPHGRDRVWFVAKNAMRSGCAHGEHGQGKSGIREQRNVGTRGENRVYLQTGDDSDTDSDGLDRCDKQNEIDSSKRRVDAQCNVESLGGNATNAPSQRHRRGNYEPGPNQPKGRWEMGGYTEEHWHGVWCEIAGCCWFATNPTSERGKWVVARKQRKIGDAKQIKLGGVYRKEFATNTECIGRGKMDKNIQSEKPNWQRTICDGWFRFITYPNRVGQKSGHVASERNFFERYGTKSFNSPTDWSQFPTQSPVCGGDDGISNELDSFTFFDGIGKPRKPITFSKWRQEAVKAYGNAIVPQVALQIFKAIIDTEK